MRAYRVYRKADGLWYIQLWRWLRWRWVDADDFSNPYAKDWMAENDLTDYYMGV